MVVDVRQQSQSSQLSKVKAYATRIRPRMSRFHVGLATDRFGHSGGHGKGGEGP